MSVPASLAPYAVATQDGWHGAATVTVYGPAAGAPATPAPLALSDVPEVVCGDEVPAFGGGLLDWSGDFTFDDPDGLIEGMFGGDFEPADHAVHV